MLGRSLRHSLASTPPFAIGTSTDSPVRLSVIVMLSGTGGALLVSSGVRVHASQDAITRVTPVAGRPRWGARPVGRWPPPARGSPRARPGPGPTGDRRGGRPGPPTGA